MNEASATDSVAPEAPNLFAFIHIPKTAGTSFRGGLEARFRRVYSDYRNNPERSSPLVREVLYNDATAPLQRTRARLLRILVDDAAADTSEPVFLCGHFRYRHYPFGKLGVPVITFLRDPLERVVSSHQFASRFQGDERSLEEFTDDPRTANLQSAFLDGIELEELAFIGIAERYEESVNLFGRRTGFDIPVLERNLGTRVARLVRFRRSATRRRARRLDPAIRELVLARNERDVELYRAGRELVDARLEAAALGA